MSTGAGGLVGPDQGHLEARHQDGRTRLYCRVCERAVSVGSAGAEYGHIRRAPESHPHPLLTLNARCPHRPESVDPERALPEACR